MGKISLKAGFFCMKKRTWLFYGLTFLILCGLSFRIFTLSDEYTAQAANNQSTVTLTVANTRGTIYDRHGTPLVNANTVYRAGVTSNPTAITALSEVLEESSFERMSQTLQSGRPAVVQLEKLVAAKDGISLFQVPERYGERLLAPHLLGYMDAGQSEGLSGLEAAFDDLLTQYNGTATVSYSVDATGKLLEGVTPVLQNTTNRSKGGLVLTLDAKIQEMVEDVAAKYMKKGAVVVMKPDGDLLAMASLPTFQPKSVADVLQDTDSPLLNRALCRYNCGSVFKIVSAAAALENGKSDTTPYDCDGNIAVGNVVFHCHNRLGHGLLDMNTAFSKSCNCYFIQLTRDVGGNALWQLAEKLQFNRTIPLCDGLKTETATLPEVETLVSPAVLANLSFGQGELTATPLHIAQLIGTVLQNGKLVSPQIIEGYMDENGTFTEAKKTKPQEQMFSVETALRLRIMMEKVVSEEGTGLAGKPLIGGAGAKTGTAETGWQRAEGEKSPVVQSWYAGYYPAGDPRYVIVVLAENADNTNAKTAPIFKEIAENLFQMESDE